MELLLPLITWHLVGSSRHEFNKYDSPYICAFRTFKQIKLAERKLLLLVRFLTHSVGFPAGFVLFLSKFFLRFLYLQAHTRNTLKMLLIILLYQAPPPHKIFF